MLAVLLGLTAEGPRVRHDGTTFLFGLPGVRVRDVERDGDGARVVHVVTDDEAAAACPQCGVFSSSVRQRRTTRPRDLRYGEQQLGGAVAHGPVRLSRAAMPSEGVQRADPGGAGSGVPELERLAGTIEAWWPEVLGFLQTGVTNARTEGCNRVIKQITRVACGFRNQANYERRIMLHSAALRAA
jgi:transposase